MIKRKIADLDLRQIAESGQCFRMVQKSEGVYAVSAFEKYLEIEQKGDLFFFSCTEKEFEETWEVCTQTTERSKNLLMKRMPIFRRPYGKDGGYGSCGSIYGK